MHNRFGMNPKEAWEPFEPNSRRPWSNRLAAHLLRRTGFGGTIKEIVEAKQAGLKPTLNDLFDIESAKSYDTEMAISGRLVTGGQDSRALAAWWLLRMVQTPAPFEEKMTLFWHGHFATGADKVQNARAMLRQNQQLRSHALQTLQPLVSLMSRDVAMLVYLDSTENRKTRPNENYARELMELFCLGPGNYSEKDIKEIARCFTGWEVRRHKFRFNPYQHDNGNKSFLGVHGKFDGEDAIRVILQQPAATSFIAKKLIRFFVFDEEEITDELAEPIATGLRESDFDVKLAMRQILSSRLFFSERAVGKKIKSPVELAIGTLRLFDASVNMQELSEDLLRLGQLPLYPPNVKGWEGGRTWINASTILARANLIQKIVTSGKTKFSAGSFSQWSKSNASHGTEVSLAWVNEFLFAEPLPNDQLKTFQKELGTGTAATMTALAALPAFQLN